MNNFDQIINRQNTKSEKWDTLENNTALPFTVADTDFGVATEIIEGIRKRAQHPILGYTTLEDSFYDSITSFVKRHHSWNISKEAIHITPGVMAGVGIALDSLTQEGDEIIIQTPVYTPFFRVIEKNNRKIVRNPLILKDGLFTINFTQLDQQLATAKALLLCNPHNPTGRVYTKEELEKIAQLAQKHQVLIISDEIHSDIIYEGYKHIPIASISDYAKANTITMIAPSKTFNIPGLSTSVAIIENPEIRKIFFNKLRALGLHEGNVFGVEALEIAYSKCDSWLFNLREYLEENSKLVEAFIKDKLPKVVCSLPEGTFLMWLDFSSYGDHRAIIEALIKADVILTDGLIYGHEALGYLRLNIGCPKETLIEGLNRIYTGIKALGGNNA